MNQQAIDQVQNIDIKVIMLILHFEHKAIHTNKKRSLTVTIPVNS